MLRIKRTPNPISCCILSSIIILCVGCNRNGKTAYLPVEGETTVTLDSIASPAILNATAMTISGEYLAVVNSGRDSIVDIFNLADGSYAGSGIRNGEGPDEILAPNLMQIADAGENLIAIMTGAPSEVAMISLPDMRVRKQEYRLPEEWGYVQSLAPLSDDLYFAQQGDMPMNWAIADKEGNIKSLFRTELPDEITDKIPQDEFSQMMAQTATGVHSEKEGMTAICYRTTPRVALFDGQGRCTAVLNNDAPWRERSVWIVDAQDGDGSFFVNIHNPEDTDFTHSTILEIDWEGNIVNTYNVPIAVGAFAIDPGNRMLYFTTYHDSDFIYTAKL